MRGHICVPEESLVSDDEFSRSVSLTLFHLPSLSLSLSGSLGLSHVARPVVPSSLALHHALPTRIARRSPLSSLITIVDVPRCAFDTRNRLVVFSEGSRLSPATPDGAPLAHILSLSLSLIAYSPTGSPTGLPRSSALSNPPLSSPRHYTIRSVSWHGRRASQLHGTRQLRNNNNAVRRCVASCGVRHRNATPWIVWCVDCLAFVGNHLLITTRVSEGRNPRGKTKKEPLKRTAIIA